MMKKKNVAMAMAAVTAASTFAPIVANAAGVAKTEEKEVLKSDQGKLVAELRKIIDLKYTDTDELVYEIKVNYEDKEPETITKISRLNEILNAEDNKVTTIGVLDNGHLVDGENIEKQEVKTYKNADELLALVNKYNTSNSTLAQNLGITAKYDTTNNVAKFSYRSTGSDMFEMLGGATLAKDFKDVEVGSKLIKTNDTTGQLVINVSTGKTTTEMTLTDFNIEMVDTLYARATQAMAYECTSGSTTKATLKANLETMKSAVDVSSLENIEFGKTGITQAEVIKERDRLIEDIAKAKKLVDAMADNNTTASTTVANAYNAINEDLNGKAFNILFAQSQMNRVKGLALKNDKTNIAKTLYEIKIVDKTVEEVKAEDLFDGLMLTEKAEELLNSIGTTFDGTTTTQTAFDEDNARINKLTDGTYELTMPFITTTTTLKAKARTVTPVTEVEHFEVKVTDAKKANLEKILSIFQNQSVAASKIVGIDRYETAAKICAENSKPMPKNGAVVLVGGEAIVDGLAAAPFANAIDAPVLLTEKGSLNKYAEREIKRLLVNDSTVANLATQTVYIVGGESVVGAEVVEAIEAMGLKVERLSGDDREATSLKVAEKMAKLTNVNLKDAFVVGGNGEADAMSIAAHAASKYAPIIVTTKESTLSKETKKFLEGRNIDIIGGESVVSEELETELKAIDADKKIVRTKGGDRFETNANVINKYYKGMKKLYIAKDGYVEGKDKLVDALAISTIAAANNGAIVLATEDLTLEQQEALEVSAGSATEMTQVGGGVSETVINKVAKLIGLIK